MNSRKMNQMKIKRLGPVSRIKLLFKSSNSLLATRPFASEVVFNYIRLRNYPAWTAFFIKYNSVVNDHFSYSCFNFQIDQHNYQILRTGCYPFVKYHCTKTKCQDLDLQNSFFNLIKIMNFGKLQASN